MVIHSIRGKYEEVREGDGVLFEFFERKKGRDRPALTQDKKVVRSTVCTFFFPSNEQLSFPGNIHSTMTNDMLRNMYKGRPPPLPPHLDDDDDDSTEGGDAFDSHSSSFLNPSPAVHPSKLRQGGGAGRGGLNSISNRYAPLEWNTFFQEKRSVTVLGQEAEGEADITFTVYETKGKPGAPVFVMHHGAGLAALSFALTAREIRKLVGDEVGVLSYDARGHGTVQTSPLGGILCMYAYLMVNL